MGGQVLDYEAKRIAREAAAKATAEAAAKAEIKTREAVAETEKNTTLKNNIEAIKNMIYFGVPKEKIMSKYSQDLYDKAVQIIEQESNEPKEM